MWIIRAASRRALNRRRYLKLRNFYHSAHHGHSRGSRLVAQMLGTIEAMQRRVLELVFFEGLTMQEVAERTGDSLGSVRHRYYRGLHRMRRLPTFLLFGKRSTDPIVSTKASAVTG
jgi:RNA polymerase sigma-70 factor, ECF subfamily